MKKVTKKVTKEVKKGKVEKELQNSDYKGLSISQINFKMLGEGRCYLEIENVVKKLYPESKYQKTHYYWYIQRRKKQIELGLDTSHLKYTTSKIYDLLDEKRKNKASQVKKVMKTMKTKNKKEKNTCPDCGVKIGEYHLDGCDWVECDNCGDQLLTCECDNPTNKIWNGER